MTLRGLKGFTLVELLVALAIASILMLGLIAAFQTTQRTAAVGEAREQIYQNARVALDLMSREIKGAYIDNRNRDLVFVSADGLGGRGNSILEYDPGTLAPTVFGLGNAQTPHGIDPTGPLVFYLYADRTFGSPIFTDRVIKALGANGFPAPDLRPGPPDRLDFTCLTGNFPGNSTNESRLAEVRYIVTTETFVDDVDNDHDDNVAGGGIDENDNWVSLLVPTPTLTGVGDLISMSTHYRSEDFNERTGKIKGLSLFQLRRGIGVDTTVVPPTPMPVVVDRNPFSTFEMATGDGTPADPQGRYPARSLADFETTNNGENIGSYIYDLQLEFYGRIAIALDAGGAPEVWGVGWDYQDVRGEDVGTDANGAAAIQTGTVTINDTTPTTVTQTGATDWPVANDALINGIFFTWPSSPPVGYTYDVTDPNNDVYRIVDSTSTTITLDRPFMGPYIAGAYTGAYRIIEPTQANGLLETGEDLGADGLLGDPLNDGSGIPNNVSNNDQTDPNWINLRSIGEGNGRLDSRVVGIWDSRSPDPRNPRRAAELDGVDNDNDSGMVAGGGLGNDGNDNDSDGSIDDRTAAFFDGANNIAYATAETDEPPPPPSDALIDETNDLVDDDDLNGTPGDDGIVDDRFYDPAGKPEGIDEPDEANPNDDTLPKAVRITIAVSDSQQSLDPVVLSTTVWLSTAK